jgi:hypothetical protein
MNKGESTKDKKVWNTPAFEEISVEETLSGPMGTIVAEGGLYHT